MYNYSSYLIHYGIKGQKYGVRRFQNEDGSLTEEGKRRYGYYDRQDGTKDYKRLQKDAANDAKKSMPGLKLITAKAPVFAESRLKI